jgi:GTP-binding protein
VFIDDVTIKVQAGNGGKGAVAFNKVRLVLGPVGGDGGDGAPVYFEAVRDVNALSAYASKKLLQGPHGGNGRGQFVDGKDGEDLVLKVPVGTVATNIDTGEVRELTEPGQRVLAATGGTGGRGNFKFRSSTDTSPRKFEEGTPGESFTYRLELRLIADVGLVGLPNAGKSTLLNELTGAKSKIGDYAFTTLEPALGAYYGLIIADIPGLIEGASEGKGLGHKFLKHVRRTRVLFHLLSAESDDVVRDYSQVRAELEKYDPELTDKKEYVFLTKIDAVTDEAQSEALRALKKEGIEATPVSILDTESLARVRALLNSLKG